MSTLRARSLASLTLAVGLAVTLSGCENVRVNAPPALTFAPTLGVTYHPNSAVSPGPNLSPRAVRFFEGDFAMLQARRARYLGEVEIDVERVFGLGQKPTQETLAARASDEAAKRGGTHFITVAEGVDVRERVVENERVESHEEIVRDAYGRPVRHTVTEVTPAQTVRTETPHARFAVWRVEPTEWAALPAGLRPEPTAEVAASAQPIGGPVATARPAAPPPPNNWFQDPGPTPPLATPASAPQGPQPPQGTLVR